MSSDEGAMAPKLTIPNLKRFDRDPETTRLRLAVLTSRLIAKSRRAEVDAYIRPIFERFGFVDGETGEPLKTPRDLYLVADLKAPEVLAYDAACDAARRAHGYDLPEGHCPALVAEHEVIRAERALLQHAAQAFDVAFHEAYGEDRERALDLFLRGGK